jgi:hypothetical protein
VGILALVVVEVFLFAGPAAPVELPPSEATTQPVAVAPPAASQQVVPTPQAAQRDEPVAIAVASAQKPSELSTTADDPPVQVEERDSTVELTAPAPARPRPPNPPARAWTPQEMQASLLKAPEVSLQNPSDYHVARTGKATRTIQPILAVVDHRPNLQGLPLHRGRSVQLSASESDAFRDTSVLLRKSLSELAGDKRTIRRLSIRPEVLKARPDVVARLLHQMLQVEPVQLRRVLIALLESIRHPAASRALVNRAVYEPVEELRKLAVDTLASRPVGKYLSTLLDAVASPWPPATDHAADSLTSLAPPDAIPELARRLDVAADDEGPRTIGELVRVNHARNCLLCHAQSVSRRDGVRVAVPSPVRPLPPPFSLATYEGGGKGGSSVPPDTVFARPDFIFLKQDFSWMLPVSNPGPWPELQRFDFMVRTRPVRPGEPAPTGLGTPRRQAVLRALRALTGKDLGERAADWRAGLDAVKNGG